MDSPSGAISQNKLLPSIAFGDEVLTEQQKGRNEEVSAGKRTCCREDAVRLFSVCLFVCLGLLLGVSVLFCLGFFVFVFIVVLFFNVDRILENLELEKTVECCKQNLIRRYSRSLESILLRVT